MARDTVNYRIKCAQASFARLNVALKKTSKLSLRGKIRLWNAVVHSTLRYGITCTGFDIQGMQKYRALFMRHLRAICESPTRLSSSGQEWIAHCTLWCRGQLRDIALQRSKRSLRCGAAARNHRTLESGHGFNSTKCSRPGLVPHSAGAWDSTR